MATTDYCIFTNRYFTKYPHSPASDLARGNAAAHKSKERAGSARGMEMRIVCAFITTAIMNFLFFPLPLQFPGRAMRYTNLLCRYFGLLPVVPVFAFLHSTTNGRGGGLSPSSEERQRGRVSTRQHGHSCEGASFGRRTRLERSRHWLNIRTHSHLRCEHLNRMFLLVQVESMPSHVIVECRRGTSVAPPISAHSYVGQGLAATAHGSTVIHNGLGDIEEWEKRRQSKDGPTVPPPLSLL